ncbi:hypothetical protein GKZ27_03575 [Enterorhabdus mucosicola]|uniref:HTH luxR-type domain-containing protein n=1 Tax=Adlercreutzia mucosicola TaxID=580026 RepID=A0A6N8JKW3_9ACTN|nr:helix-turn-helix transcriptional regulator [Adlercreutzia mucosicola]MVX60541.1 hypothetical protein [Adlercreutzia mucosicola]
MAHSSAPGAAPGALSRLEGALKLRYLGIGFIWAWIYGSYETFAVYPERTGVGINADDSWIISATAVVVTMFATGLLLGRRPAAPHRQLALASSIAAAAGTVLSALPALGSYYVPVLFASGLLTGFGTGALYVLWGQALARLDAESAEVAIPSASLVTFAGALVLPYLPGLAGVTATATLPLLSGLLLWLTYRDPAVIWEEIDPRGRSDARRVSGESTRDGRSEVVSALLPAPIVRISALAFLSYFTVGCCGALQQGADDPFTVLGLDLPTLIGSLGGIILMACFVLFAARPRFDSLFRLIAPLVVGSAALLPWADLWAVFLSATLVSLADIMLTIATVLFVTDAARRGLVNAAAGVGITQGSLQLGVLLGNITGSAASPLAAASPTGLFSVALGLTAFFALAWLLYPAERDRHEGGARRGTAAPKPVGPISELPIGSTAEAIAEGGRESTLETACNALAESHGLSGREREILGYLARGRSQPYIREELVLSKNTVASHVKHIYQKLDVHSRQELLDLFE